MSYLVYGGTRTPSVSEVILSVPGFLAMCWLITGAAIGGLTDEPSLAAAGVILHNIWMAVGYVVCSRGPKT